MKKPGESPSSWTRRLDDFLAPRLQAAATDLEEVDRMDWELWLLVVLVLLMLALAFLLNHFPELIGSGRTAMMAPELETYLDGFAVIVLFFTIYVIQKHRQLVETRRRLMRARIDQEGLSHRLELIEVLFGVSSTVTSRAGTQRSFEDVLDHLREVMGGEHAVLWRWEEDPGDLVLVGHRGGEGRPGDHIPEGAGYAGWVARHGKNLLLDTSTDRGRFGDLDSLEERAASGIYVPLVADERLLGVLAVITERKGRSFSSADLKLVQIFGNSLAAAMSNDRLITRLRESLRRNEEVQMQLLQTEKLAALGELMAGISHELNNPLSVVTGQAELLLEEDPGEEVRERLETMLQEAARARKLVENLLRTARGDRAPREELDINDLVRQSLDLMRFQLEQEGVDCILELQEGLPETALDPFEFQQLIFNLVNNARQAMSGQDRPSRLIVTTRFAEEGGANADVRGPALHLTIRDTGPGIPTERVGRIFEPFYTTKDRGEGTGLGLSICHRIVRGHGGRIEAANHGEGGARLDVWLPLQQGGERAAGEEPLRAGPPPAGPPVQGEVLVVDDERRIQELLEETLGLVGHRVRSVSDGHEALTLLEEGYDPDVIVLDLKMPVMDGEALFQRIQQDHPRLVSRVLFLTGDVLSRSAREFLEGAGRPYMSKPFQLRALREAVESVLRGDS
ncbi:MAG: ATP-binding protein [bacterium]